MPGKCPKCEKPVTHVRAENITVNAVGGPWVGVSYICPSCTTVLSVSIDPIAVKTDIVKEILRG